MCEQELISTKRAGAATGRYFDMLFSNGYVKHASKSRLLVMLFVLDVVKYMSAFISDSDYVKLGALMRNIEGIDCLLPYNVFCLNRSQYFANGTDGPDYAGPRT